MHRSSSLRVLIVMAGLRSTMSLRSFDSAAFRSASLRPAISGCTQRQFCTLQTPQPVPRDGVFFRSTMRPRSFLAIWNGWASDLSPRLLRKSPRRVAERTDLGGHGLGVGAGGGAVADPAGDALADGG